MPDPTPQPPEPRPFAPAPSAPSRPLQATLLHPSRKKWILWILTLIMFSTTMDYMVLMPLGPTLMNLFNISAKEFSFLVSIYSFSAGVFGLIGSLIFDRIHRKTALIGSYLGFLIGTLFCAYASSFPALLIARGVAGAFGGLLSGICYAIVADLFVISERGLATGKLLNAYSFASIAGVPIGLYLSHHLGWHATFGAIVVVGTFTLVVATQAIPAGNWGIRFDHSSFFSGITENLRDSNARKSLLTTLMMVHSQFVVIPFISAYLVTNAGLPAFHLPHIYLLGGLLTVASGVFMGRLCDRLGAHNVFVKTGLLFLIPVYGVTHLGHTSLLITLGTTTALFVLSNFRSVPAMTLISSSVPSARRGSFMSLNTCIHQLGAASATFLAGWVVTEGQGGRAMTGFGTSSYLSILFGVFAYLLGRRIRMIS